MAPDRYFLGNKYLFLRFLCLGSLSLLRSGFRIENRVFGRKELHPADRFVDLDPDIICQPKIHMPKTRSHQVYTENEFRKLFSVIEDKKERFLFPMLQGH